VQQQQTRNKRSPTSHKAVMFQCCPHLTLCRSASTPDSSSTSLHRACSRVSPSSRKPARVEYLQSQHTINTWTSMDVTGPACSRVSPSSSKPARVEYLHRDTPLNLWGTSVCPAQGSPQGWESCTTHTPSHHGQQLAHDPCKEACKGGGTAPNLKRRVLPHADMLALSYVCWTSAYCLPSTVCTVRTTHTTPAHHKMQEATKATTLCAGCKSQLALHVHGAYTLIQAHTDTTPHS
jgi:preprotein translocase subunit Sss1